MFAPLQKSIAVVSRFDALSIASWSSVGLLLLTQTNLIDPGWIPFTWAISMVGLASCLALSDLRLRRTESEMRALNAATTIDPLTGVGNRRWLEIEFKQRFAQLRRQNAPFSVMMIDIDHFKSVNDTWGHDAGDAILVTVANAVRNTLRDMDVLCRIGGEEFVAILPGSYVKAALSAAERVRQAVESTVTHVKQRPVSVTISVGVTAAIASDQAEDTLKRADDALYAAKRAGRNLCYVKTALSLGCVDVRDRLLDATVNC